MRLPIMRDVGRGVAVRRGDQRRRRPRQAVLARCGRCCWSLPLLRLARYSNLPQPHTASYSLHKPNLTNYSQQPPAR